MYSRYGRSTLCTPAIAVDRYARCHRSGADICLVDLEDSVPPDRKAQARQLAAGFFGPDAGPVRCAIRVNTVTEPDGLRDLLAVRDYPVPPGIVLVPKVESPRDLEIVESVLRPGCPQLELLAVIETPRGLDRSDVIARSSDRLRGLIFGSADYAAAMGIGLGWESLVYARSRLANSARAAGIEAIDSPQFDLTDLGLLRREAEGALGLGYSGKIALNPRQVTVINEVFSPGTDELEHARQVVLAGHRAGRAIATVGSSMVGRPFFEASQRLLDEFAPAAGPFPHPDQHPDLETR
ncbi:MAG TPA: CoA ester lyase [Jatrophihabitans sp.]|nr:CoA ester lyase [Jatrophihabitans sp.]